MGITPGRGAGPKKFFKKVLTNWILCAIIRVQKRKEMICMKYPYIACPHCESQMLNPTLEDGMLHFVCECGCEVWYDGELEEEYV